MWINACGWMHVDKYMWVFNECLNYICVLMWVCAYVYVDECMWINVCEWMNA